MAQTQVNPAVNTIIFDSLDPTGSSHIYSHGLDDKQLPVDPLCAQTPVNALCGVASGGAGQEAQEPTWSLTAGARFDMLGRIAYQFGATGVRGIHIVKPDGTGDIQLTPPSGSGFINNRQPKTPYPCLDARDPAWSPDGRYIVYACLEVEDPSNPTLPTSYDLWIHDTNSTPDTTNDDTDYPLLVLNGALALRPAWSPDGNMIAFVTNLGGNIARGMSSKIGLVSITGLGGTVVLAGSPQILTDDPYNDTAPAWSPNSRFIAFSSTRKAAAKSGNRTIWRINIADSSIIQLTTGAGTANDTNPAWSPSGMIAFQSDRSNGNHIWVMDSAHPETIGGLVTQVSGCQQNCQNANTINDQNPAWKPGLIGVDVSGIIVSTSQWTSLKQNGLDAVIVAAWGGTHPFTSAAQNLLNAQAAGLVTGANVLLNFNSALTGDEQVEQAIGVIGGALGGLKVVVVDVEEDGDTPPVAATNVQKTIREAVSDIVGTHNLHAAVYTRRGPWSTITNDSPEFTSLPLWDIAPGVYPLPSNIGTNCGDGSRSLSLDANPQTAPSGQHLSAGSFVPYPRGTSQWFERHGKQYDRGETSDGGVTGCNGNQQVAIGGVLSTADLDVFDSALFTGGLGTYVASGSNVVNQPLDPVTGIAPVTVTFATVKQSGFTMLTSAVGGPPAPPGFKSGIPLIIYDVTTGAIFNGLVQVCINYAGITYDNPSRLKIFHFENGGWTDRTLSQGIVEQVICAGALSLSPFAVFEQVTQSTPMIVVTGGTFAYDGLTHGATANAAGVSGGPVSGSFTFTYTPGGSSPPVNVGTYSVTAQFTSNDPNYTNASSTGTITITPAIPTQTVSLTGSMQFARVSHQATLLANGLVLVSGGQNNGTAMPQAELFNPATGTWTLTGSNVIPRFDHTATLLQDGRVLATGGVSSNGDCSSNVTAETYDSASGTWSLTGRLPSPVGTGHIAIRLLDGRVLVSGGGDRCGTVFNTAAVFDPSANKWSATGSMTAAREFHSAALLPDGRVLVAGGVTSSPFPAVASAEIYDPVAGTWTAVATMSTARLTSCNGYEQTYLATLSGGAVLAAGGFSGPNCYSITPARTVVGMTVDPSPALLSNIGQTRALTVTAQMSDGSTQLFTGPLQFSSADTTIANVDSNGLITSLGAGTTTVTVTASGIAPVGVTTTVASRSLTSIIVSPPSITLIGSTQTQALTINGKFSDGSQQALTTGVTFTSSNLAVASVDQTGLVTSGANGTASITASAQGAPAVQIPITVKSLVSIVVSPTSITLTAVGQTQALAVTGQFSDGSQQTLAGSLSFLSSNPSVARVDLSGNVTAISIGSATITVSLPNVAAVQVPVTIAPTPVVLSVNPSSGLQGQQNISVSLTGQFTHWVQGTTTASFGSGTTVTTLTVNSFTTATASFNIDPAATPGPRTITLITGSEIATLANGFTIVAQTPMLVSVNPSSGPTGQQNLSVGLTGQFTRWVQATTTASFGDGIAISSLTVNSPTSATAVLTIDPATTIGPRTVTLTTASEEESLVNGFFVTGGPAEADAKPFSVLNLAGVTGGKPIALEVDAVQFSVLNTSGVGGTGGRQSSEVDAADISVLNLAGVTGGKAVPMEADAVPFSVLNTSGPGGGGGGSASLFEVDALVFSVLNLAGVNGNQPVHMEVDGVPFSVQNGTGQAVSSSLKQTSQAKVIPKDAGISGAAEQDSGGTNTSSSTEKDKQQSRQ